MAAPTDQAQATRNPMPDVFTGLLLVAMILLGLATAAMFFTNTEHSKTDHSLGGPISIVDSQ